MAIKLVGMKDSVQRLNAEYHLQLSDEEIATIAKQAAAAQELFQRLFEVDVASVPPAIKIDAAEKK